MNVSSDAKSVVVAMKLLYVGQKTFYNTTKVCLFYLLIWVFFLFLQKKEVGKFLEAFPFSITNSFLTFKW